MRILKPLITIIILAAVAYGLYIFLIFPLLFPTAKVINVVDGDTLMVLEGQKTHLVQLIGVDAPEKIGPTQYPQCYEYESRHETATNFLGKDDQIRLVSDKDINDKDQNNHLLRYVYLKNGEMLNEKMLLAGLGRQYVSPDKKYRYQDRLAQAQSKAQAQKTGIWSPQGCNGQF